MTIKLETKRGRLMPDLNPVPDETCAECGKEFYGKAARYNKDMHMRYIHPGVPWVAAPKKKTSHERRKAKKGLLSHTGQIPEEAKVVALALLDITASVHETSQCTAIPVKTLEEWEKAAKANKRKRNDNSIAGKAERFVESMLTLMLLRSSHYTPEQMMKITTVLCGAIPGLRTRALPPPPSPKPAEPGPSPTPDAGAPQVDDERKKWLDIVDGVMRDKTNTQTREQVIESLIAQRPEAKQYLQPEPSVPEETEAVN